MEKINRKPARIARETGAPWQQLQATSLTSNTGVKHSRETPVWHIVERGASRNAARDGDYLASLTDISITCWSHSGVEYAGGEKK